MEHRTIEQLFEQFRERGDVAALGVVFDRTAPELLRVAQHLAGDMHAAEDALQSAFSTAIEDARAWDASRPLFPWLLGILANRVRELRRARRPLDPGRVAERPHADPESEVRARELASAIDSSLTKVPEPYHTVLTRHLRDGRTPAEIASELGRAPGTVRVQLSRGLELVRRALPPSLAIGGAALASAGRGHAAVRADVLARAAQRLPRAPARLTTSVPIGALPAQLALLGLAVAATLGVYFSQGAAGPAAQAAQETNAVSAPLARAPDAPTLDADLGARRVLGANVLQAAAASANAPGIWIVGRVLGAHDIDLARIRVAASTPQFAPHEPVQVHADASFAIEVTRIVQEDEAPTTCRVALTLESEELVRGRAELVLGPEVTRQTRDARSELRCDVTAVSTCGVRGRVTGIDERAGAIAVLYAYTPDGGLDPRLVSRRTTEDGAFELRTSSAGLHRLLVTAPPLAPVSVDLRVTPGTWVDVGTLAPVLGGVEIAGKLELPTGVFASGATLLAERRYATEPDATFGHVALFRDRVELASQFASVEPDGTFRILGLTPGAYDVTLVVLPDVDGVFGGARAANVLAPAEGLLLGAEAQLVVVDVEHAGKSMNARTEWTFAPGERTATRRVHGRERFLVDAQDDIQLVAHAGDTHSDEVNLYARGRTRETVVHLDPTVHAPLAGTLALAITPVTDAPRHVRVTLTPRTRAEQESVTLDLALDGDVYVSGAVACGAYGVAVEPLEDDTGLAFTGFSRFAARDVVIDAGHSTRCVLEHTHGGRIRVRCAGDATPGSVAAFAVRDARAGEHPLRAVYRTNDDEVFWDAANARALPLDRESELFPNLPAGAYVLELTDGPFAGTSVTATVREREVTSVVLTLTPR